ncbi:Methyltransferase-like protein 22 [Lamellibrachia satsuma]|nr:Methyltransferase-like protein 22 [Lamellibrachia satsuma]
MDVWVTVVISRFVYRQDDEANSSDVKEEFGVDKDGDFVVTRKRAANKLDVMIIEHAMGTTLEDVGLQVWLGSLLLCDYIFDNKTTFSDVVVLDLGAGTGLASIAMATVAKQVFCTDTGLEILEACERNAWNNRHLFRNSGAIHVRELNWMSESLKNEGAYSWTPTDVEALNSVQVILAADVIYEDTLTDAFFLTVNRLMCQPPSKSLFLSIEKRLNFSLLDLDVACPAYNHFRKCLNDLQETEGTHSFNMQQIDTAFPQFLQYERTQQLELWKITTSWVLR